ncbi:MAG: hypothetical protein DI628_04080 [Blastochloris viridis]|uniref:Uncharacterized protein n=1 Tax=Blastochloris viridis TaxID=1079 RepID=A0A6N4RFF7_BLAVI|nr:MAG: hypothetical protein DI628_04080 [Blastochloris viridis]
MKTKGLFNQLRTQVNATAKNMVKGFKKKHKLSGASPKVTQIFEKGAWYRGTFLLHSLVCLLALVFLMTAMLLLKEDSVKVVALMGDTVTIAGACALVLMQFLASLLAWGTWKLVWMLCGYLWTFAAPVGAFLMSYGDMVPHLWNALIGYLF